MLLSTLLLLGALAYFGALALLITSPRAQNALIFLHRLAPPAWTRIAPLQDLARHRLAGTARNVAADNGIRGWHVLPPGPPLPPPPSDADGAREHFFDARLAAPREKVVLFFHGNSGTRAFPFKRVAMLRLLGAHLAAHVVTFDYSGFGDSPGRPSEGQLYADAAAAYAWVRRRVADDAEIIVYGQSLGTFAAVYLASALFPAGGASGGDGARALLPPAGPDVVRAVVLDAPPASLVDATMTHPSCRIFRALPRARDLAAWALFGSTLDNCARLATVRAGAVPVLVLHGQDDGFIPIEQGRRVAQAGRDAGLDVTLVDFPNTGHVNVNGAEGFLRTLTSFLQGAPASGSGGGGGKSAAV